MVKKAYIVDYGMKNKNGTDYDTAIVFAENETEVKSVMENYGVKSGLKLSSKNLGSNNENVTGLPIYMSIFL